MLSETAEAKLAGKASWSRAVASAVTLAQGTTPASTPLSEPQFPGQGISALAGHSKIQMILKVMIKVWALEAPALCCSLLIKR